MKSMMLTGIRQMEMKDTEKPVIMKDTDVLIKMKVVGVCGSDVHYYTQGRIGSQIVKYPFTVGHEGAGIVEKTGRSVTNVKPGDRIAIEPAMPCFDCDQCRAGRHNTCRRLKFLGCPGQAAGCLSEYIVIPHTSCLSIPDGMILDEAAISEPLSIGLYALNQSKPVTNADIGILGVGPIGTSVLLSARAAGTGRIFVSDKLDYRLYMAESSGASLAVNTGKVNIVKKMEDYIPDGLDIIFECCGQQDAMDEAIEMIKPGGKIIIVGIPEFDNWILKTDKIRRKEITLINIRRQNHTAPAALKMISDKQVNVSNMVTHRFGFEHTKEAFDMVSEYKDGVLKAMIDL